MCEYRFRNRIGVVAAFSEQLRIGLDGLQWLLKIVAGRDHKLLQFGYLARAVRTNGCAGADLNSAAAQTTRILDYSAGGNHPFRFVRPFAAAVRDVNPASVTNGFVEGSDNAFPVDRKNLLEETRCRLVSLAKDRPRGALDGVRPGGGRVSDQPLPCSDTRIFE